jgi:hypothetical protein
MQEYKEMSIFWQFIWSTILALILISITLWVIDDILPPHYSEIPAASPGFQKPVEYRI